MMVYLCVRAVVSIRCSSLELHHLVALVLPHMLQFSHALLLLRWNKFVVFVELTISSYFLNFITES